MFWYLVFAIQIESAIFEYRFNSNYGYAIYDYSGNSLHGYKEKYSTSNTLDCVFTDRGIFIQSDCHVRVSSPSSYYATFNIPNPSTFLVWVNSKDTNGRLFFKYKSTSCFYVFRVKSNSSVRIQVCDPTSSTSTGYASSFIAGKWNLISLCFYGSVMSVYTNGGLITSLNFNAIALEPGQIILGSNYLPIPSIDGFVWFFTAIAEDQAHNNFITGSSQNCFTTTCSVCSPAMDLYFLGIGCVSEQLDVYSDNEGNTCGSSTLSCRNNLIIDCLCSPESCIYNFNNTCGCLNIATGNADEKACDCSPLSGQGCCSTNCKTCSSSDQNTCLSCYATYSYIDSTNDCSCMDGYYGTKPLALEGSCIQCKNDCLTCIDGTNCSTCKAANTYIENGICKCIEGYYEFIESDGSLLCLKCKEDCSTCIEKTSCVSCISTNSEIINGDCTCLIGYYNQTSLNTANACLLCDNKCASCIDGNSCTECASDFLYIENGQCFCSSGFWSDSSLACVDCHTDCKTCNQSNVCIDCLDINSIHSSVGCVCNDGFFESYTSNDQKLCVQCMSDCINCVNFTHCSECKSLNAIPSPSGGCECKDFYANNSALTSPYSCYPCLNNQKTQQGICLCPNFSESCLSLCKTFTLSGTCKECTSKSELHKGSCRCLNSELIIDLECSSLYFEVFVSINLKNQIKLMFSKSLKSPLNKSNLNVTSLQYPESYLLNQLSDYEYLIELKKNKSSKLVKIEFDDDLISNDSSIFLKKVLQIKTFEISEDKQNQVYYENLALNSMLFGMGVCLSLGIIQLDLSSFYNLMNFGEIYSLISLYGLDIHPDLLAYLINLRVKKELPRALVLFAQIDSKTESESVFKAYGFETTLFCLNSGMNILILLALLFIFFIQRLILSKLAERVKIIVMLKNYFEYNAFLRYFIQSFLDLLISCLYSLKHISVSTLSGAYDLYLSLLFIICQFYFYIYSIFLIQERKTLIKNEDIERFENKFESYFKNFRSLKTRRVLFYLIFMTKRYFLTGIVFFINDPVLKLILSFTLSGTVFFYLFYFKCFKNRFNNFVHYYNELSTMLVYVTIFVSLVIDSDQSKLNSQIIVIILINISLGINIIFVGCSLVFVIKKNLCSKGESNKVVPGLVKVANNVEEVKQSDLRDSSEIDLSRLSEAGRPNSLKDDMSDFSSNKEIQSAISSVFKEESNYLEPNYFSKLRESKYSRSYVDYYNENKDHQIENDRNNEINKISQEINPNSLIYDSFESKNEL